MTEDHDSLPEPDDDASLDEALLHLKRLEPPLESRVANRLAVATALGALNSAEKRRELSWWRRSISVPVPIAACLVVLMALAVSANFRDRREQLPLLVNSPENRAEGDPNARVKQSPLAKHPRVPRAELKYYETETYLCGIGRVSSEAHYSIQE